MQSGNFTVKQIIEKIKRIKNKLKLKFVKSKIESFRIM